MEICRLCFDSHSASFVLLNLENESPHRKQLGVVFPEIDLEAVSVPYLCSKCSAALESAYMCKRTWLACEERLKRYMERNPDFPSYFISDIVKESALPESVVKIEDEYSEIAVKLEVDLSPGSPDPLDFATELQDVEVKSEIEDDIEKDTVQSDMADEDKSDINLYIEQTYQMDCQSTILEKSKERYEKAYGIFKKWLDEKKVVITEKTLVAYFVQRNLKLKSPGSLWAEYSMLKSTINLKNGIDISQFNKLLAFLKKKNIGHRPKKSKVFTREEINKFLLEAPDKTYIMMKVVVMMGIAGGLRREELMNMTVDDITDQGSVVIVNVPDNKTYVPRTFRIVDKPNEKVNFLKIYRKYAQLRPKETKSRRFFYSIRQGKCINQFVGINTMGQVPQKIAEYLNLQDPKSYTGHAFRRTSASLLASNGIDYMKLKRDGGWKFY